MPDPAPIIIPSEAALAELQRLRALAPHAIAGGNPREQVERKIARWCAIAAWFGAVLPDELRPQRVALWGDGEPVHPLWLYFAPEGAAAADWRTEIAKELRRDTLAALAKAEDHRAATLLALDRALSVAAELPPIGSEAGSRTKPRRKGHRMTEFYSERTIRSTRKLHHCEACQKSIEVGSAARSLAGKVDGDFFTYHYHEECRAAEAACNFALGLGGDEWLSLWACLDLSIVEADEAEKCAALLRADHPLVAARVPA